MYPQPLTYCLHVLFLFGYLAKLREFMAGFSNLANQTFILWMHFMAINSQLQIITPNIHIAWVFTTRLRAFLLFVCSLTADRALL